MAQNTRFGESRWETKQSLVVYVGTDGVPSDEQWGEYASAIVQTWKRERMKVRVLVFPEGCIPTAVQRRQLAVLCRDINVKSAVVTDGLMERGTVMALRWLGIDIKAFAPASAPEAFAYLGVSDEEREWALFAVKRMRGELSVPPARRVSQRPS